MDEVAGIAPVAGEPGLVRDERAPAAEGHALVRRGNLTGMLASQS
jgi:hypothetical protein